MSASPKPTEYPGRMPELSRVPGSDDTLCWSQNPITSATRLATAEFCASGSCHPSGNVDVEMTNGSSTHTIIALTRCSSGWSAGWCRRTRKGEEDAKRWTEIIVRRRRFATRNVASE